MDITAMRNAYGRQLGSFYTKSSFDDKDEIPMTFIRAPYISYEQYSLCLIQLYINLLLVTYNHLKIFSHYKLCNDFIIVSVYGVHLTIKMKFL